MSHHLVVGPIPIEDKLLHYSYHLIDLTTFYPTLNPEFVSNRVHGTKLRD